MKRKSKRMPKIDRAAGRAFGATLNTRLDDEAATRLDALADRLAAIGMVRSTVARLAMPMGLDSAEMDMRTPLGERGTR